MWSSVQYRLFPFQVVEVGWQRVVEAEGAVETLVADDQVTVDRLLGAALEGELDDAGTLPSRDAVTLADADGDTGAMLGEGPPVSEVSPVGCVPARHPTSEAADKDTRIVVVSRAFRSAICQSHHGPAQRPSRPGMGLPEGCP